MKRLLVFFQALETLLTMWYEIINVFLPVIVQKLHNVGKISYFFHHDVKFL